MGNVGDKAQQQTGSVLILCKDCGRSRVRFPHQFMHLIPSGSPNPMAALGDRLFCPNCRDDGGEGRNLIIAPLPRPSHDPHSESNNLGM